LEKQVFDLTGRVALVTGSSRGIGRALALGLAMAGADVAVHYVSRQREAEAVAAEICSIGRKSAVFAADLAEKCAPGRLVESVGDAFGRIDVLVLNGSMEIRKDWVATDESEFDRQVDTNLGSTLALLQQTVPGMVERGWGRIVSVGSVQEVKPNPQLLVYAALKAAQTNMIVNLARHLSATGVTFNNLAPGAIATERNAEVLADPAYASSVLARIPSGRIGVPEDCVGACVLLCSDAASYITGATIFVDGGWNKA
jgi:NAD(P)-dependent dehydrogenase (short-subunit alcohol dehydrogenase family)